MATFWQWFDATRDRAEATELGQRLLAAGWRFAHTGGGCTAWELGVGLLDAGGNAERSVYMCDEEQDVEADPASPVWGASLSRVADGEMIEGTGDPRPLDEVLDIVGVWVAAYTR